MTQSKRGPGRPKSPQSFEVKPPTSEAVQAESPPASPPKVKEPEINFQVIEKKDTARLYEIPSGGGIVYLIQSRGVTIYDEERNTVREIRYCPNEPSIYVDEQSNFALKQAVTFSNGKLIVPKTKPNLMAFLDIHPNNMANGGNLFRVVSKDESAEKELKKEFSINEAVTMVREKDINELIPVAMYYNINVSRPVSEIKYDLLREAKARPDKFVESFDNPSVKCRAIIFRAKEYNILEVKDAGVYWFDSKRLIVSNPVGREALDTMTRFCLTAEGAETFDTIKDQLRSVS
jgi:hypothetical protein